jgi:hypothetical protein
MHRTSGRPFSVCGAVRLQGGRDMSLPGSRGFRFVLAGLAILGVSIASYVAYASHNFPDVPDAASYHNAVEWVFNRGVTQGCGNGLYCPDDPVSRAQMAIFLRRLGIALTPGYLTANQELTGHTLQGAVDCKTAAYTPTYPQRAFIDARVGALAPAAGAITIAQRVVYSTDGGGSFNQTSDAWYLPGTAPASQFVHTSSTGSQNLDPGTAYIFGMQTQTFNASQATSDDFNCSLRVTVYNRNPASSPLRPIAEESATVGGPINSR